MGKIKSTFQTTNQLWSLPTSGPIGAPVSLPLQPLFYGQPALRHTHFIFSVMLLCPNIGNSLSNACCSHSQSIPKAKKTIFESKPKVSQHIIRSPSLCLARNMLRLRKSNQPIPGPARPPQGDPGRLSEEGFQRLRLTVLHRHAPHAVHEIRKVASAPRVRLRGEQEPGKIYGMLLNESLDGT